MCDLGSHCLHLYIIIVQGKTMGPRAIVIRVKDLTTCLQTWRLGLLFL